MLCLRLKNIFLPFLTLFMISSSNSYGLCAKGTLNCNDVPNRVDVQNTCIRILSEPGNPLSKKVCKNTDESKKIIQEILKINKEVSKLSDQLQLNRKKFKDTKKKIKEIKGRLHMSLRLDLEKRYNQPKIESRKDHIGVTQHNASNQHLEKKLLASRMIDVLTLVELTENLSTLNEEYVKLHKKFLLENDKVMSLYERFRKI